MKFEHLGGGIHSHKDGKDYKKGDVIEDKVMDLEKVFPGKFRRLHEATPTTQVEVTTGEATEGKKRVLKVASPEGARGEEVTDDFDKLEDGFKVFQRGGLFHVYEGKSTDPINKSGLKKSEVYSTIKKYLEE